MTSNRNVKTGTVISVSQFMITAIYDAIFDQKV